MLAGTTPTRSENFNKTKLDRRRDVKDGRYEILQEVTAFYAFDNFSSAETPLPLVVFEHDKKAGKYLPANHLFQEYALKGIASEIGNLSSDEGGYLSKRLDLALQYIHAIHSCRGRTGSMGIL